MTLSTNDLEQFPRDGAGRFLGGVPRSKVDVSERFWPKVDIRTDDECWEWKASLNTSGYGHFSLDGKDTAAHRVAYSLSIGRIPAGMQVCHHCDNRKCCNPKHFFIGTNEDNHRDKMQKGRQAKGETSGRVKLTEVEVRAMRDAVRSGVSLAYVQRYYSQPHCTIYSAVYGMTWKHVEGALTPPKAERDLVGQAKVITARDLRDATATYVGMVARGMEITITKDGEIVAVMSPPSLGKGA